MEKMTRPEMIEFLKGINQREKYLDEARMRAALSPEGFLQIRYFTFY